MLSLRAMVGSIILYDHVSEQGAFVKKSPINVRTIHLILSPSSFLLYAIADNQQQVKGCIHVLKTFQPTTDQSTDGLLNALRFTTIHLNDPETPGSIKQLLA